MHLSLSALVVVLGALPHLALSMPSNFIPYDTVDSLLEPRGGGLGLANISVSQICGTKAPTPALREIHSELRTDPETLPRLIGRSPPRPFPRRSLEERQGGILVETFIHWVTTKDQAKYYSTTLRANVITNQVRSFEKRFAVSHMRFFSFRLSGFPPKATAKPHPQPLPLCLHPLRFLRT